MFKLKYDDFLVYDEAAGSYSMPQEQKVRDETERKHWKTTGLAILKDWRLYLMLVPMVLVYLLWKYLPLYDLIACFKRGAEDDVLDRAWVGLNNFKDLFFVERYSLDFWAAFRNTFTLAFYGLLFGFPMPIILALFFNEVRSNVARSAIQVCVYLPKFFSTVIVTTLAISLFRGPTGVSGSSPGVVAKFLTLICGEGSELGKQANMANVGLIFSVRYFRAIYIVTDLWEHAGYDSIVFFAAVIAVSPTSYEAAQIDGAGKLAQMRYVVIPSILSTVVIMLIMKMGSLLSIGYEKLWLFCGTDSKDNYKVANVVSTLANIWGDKGWTAYGIAAEMINNLIGMILVIGSNFIARKASDVSLY